MSEEMQEMINVIESQFNKLYLKDGFYFNDGSDDFKRASDILLDYGIINEEGIQ
ncbi:MAG: hypothetical protein ABJG33_00190 [Balneola sp.]